MKSISIFIGRLPFVGKVAIRPLVFDLYLSTSVEKRLQSYLMLTGLLILLILLHAIWMWMGLEALGFESPVWAKVVSIAFTSANFMVVMNHIYLEYRATRFFQRGIRPRVERSYVRLSDDEVQLMSIVTVGGLAVFFFQYAWFS